MVATFHLHYLGHRIKYGDLEVRNTTQQLLSTTRPCCSIEFIESFLFWVNLVTYYIGIYIFVYILIKFSIFILFFFVIFKCSIFSALHPKHFGIWKNILWNWFLHSIIYRVMWYFWVFIVNPFSLLWTMFFSRKMYFFWSTFLLLIAESISLDTSGKSVVGFSWKLLLPLE